MINASSCGTVAALGDFVLAHPTYARVAQRLSAVEVVAYLDDMDFAVCHALGLRV